MNLEDLTLGQLKQIQAMGGSSTTGYERYLGQDVLIRTVTMIYTGRVKEIHNQCLLVEDAAWIADTERWADSVREAKFKEVEPYPDGEIVAIGLGGILDVCKIPSLPREQK